MNLSVALCSYNGEGFIEEQLESIAAQTRLPDELVICDDHSCDNTVEVIEQFARRSPFPVRLSINEKNAGSTKSFEKAIGGCEGDLIALCDQDDVWHARKLERLENVLLSSPRIGLVFSDAELVDSKLNPLGCRLWRAIRFSRTRQNQVRSGKAFQLLLSGNVVSGANMAFLSKFKDLLLPIPTAFPLIHDGWISLVIAAVADLACVDEPLTKYRQHRSQQMGAAKIGFKEMLMRAKRADASAYLKEADQFRHLYDRLLANSDRLHSEEVLFHLSAKLLHLQARAGLPNHRIMRIPFVLRELLNLRYHRFSRGMHSFAKDLLF